MAEDLPSIGVRTQRKRIEQYKSAFEPFGGSRVTQDFNSGKSDHFSGTITFARLSQSDLRTLRAWGLRVGLYGEILVPDIDNPTPTTYVDNGGPLMGDTSVTWGSTTVDFGDGILPGFGSVDGADQTGTSINLKNLPASMTVLRAGEPMVFDETGQYVVLTADLTSNASGTGTATFKPAIRVSPANNTSVTFVNPKMTAYLLTNIEEETDEVGISQQITIAYEEVI